MSQNYINQIKFNNGIRPVGNFPLDDRVLWNSIEDFFITPEEAENPRDLIDSTESMYNKVYKGMTVKLLVSEEEREEYGLVGDVVIYTCIDDSPYLPDTCQEVNKDNYLKFWREEGREVYDKVQAFDSHFVKIDTSINNLETYVQTVNITEATDGAIDIKVTEEPDGAKGKKYEISVNVDDDAVKIIDDKITGGKYCLKPVTPSNNNVTASYQLAYKAPGETEYTNLTDCTIDIAKDYVIKDVHYCKAIYTDGVYEETAKVGSDEWSTAPGKVYLHIIWHTKEEDDHITETWINVGELIALELVDINDSINRVNTSVNTLHDYVFDTVNASIINLGADIKALDTSTSSNIKALNDIVTSGFNDLTAYVQSSNISNGGGTIVDNNSSDFDCQGKEYTVKVNVDNDTIKIVNDKVTGGKYKLEKVNTTDGYFASYQLAYKAPDSNTYSKLTDCTIDIPKDFVVREVHYCKAVVEMGEYKETAREFDTNWATAPGDVYIHFIWATKNNGEKVDETWLKVADFINLDLREINNAIAKLQSDHTALNTSVNAHINSSIAALKSEINTLDSSANAHINASVTALNQTIDNKIKNLDSSMTNYIDLNVAELKNTIIENELISTNAWIDIDSRLKAAIARINALEEQLNS